MSDSGLCANCGRAIGGADQKFCPACGQPTPTHRIDWHFLGHEIEHSVLHMDRGILYTLKNLMLRPGHLIRDYLDGRRAHHVKPLMLIMITAAAVVFLSRFVIGSEVMGGDIFRGGGSADAGGNADPARILEVIDAVNRWMSHHFAAVTLLLLPLEAAAFKLAFWRCRNLNYPEWLVITAFLTAQTFVLWGLSIPVQRWYPGAAAWVLWLSIAYGVFSMVQLFAPLPRWNSALRAILGYALYLLINMVLVSVLVIIVLVVSGRT